MILVEIIIVLGTLAGVIGYGAYRLLTNEARNKLRMVNAAGFKVGEVINTAELRYEEMIERRLEKQTEKQTEKQIEQIIDEIFIVLKPDIDALLAHINATENDDVKVQYSARYFTNVVALADAYLVWRRNNVHAMLAPAEEEKMYAAFKDAMRADIHQRLLNASANIEQGWS